MSNLDQCKSNNSDWLAWIKLVKAAYKAKGIVLTQQQLMIQSRDTYPGKGNVINKDIKIDSIPLKQANEIPPNPERRKKNVVEKPKVIVREKQIIKKQRKAVYSEEEEQSYSDSSEEEVVVRRKKKQEKPRVVVYKAPPREDEVEYEEVRVVKKRAPRNYKRD
jgi:hypothetical protein